jgi:ribosomal protein S18 acetylase RimI-like enzyme
MVGSECCGFIIFGNEKHRFLPVSNGMVYELYVLPEHRRKGIGKACAIQALAELSDQGVSRIQLEVMEGNNKAAALWEQLGFRKFSERFILERGR